MKLKIYTEKELLRQKGKHLVTCPVCGETKIESLFEYKPSVCSCNNFAKQALEKINQ